MQNSFDVIIIGGGPAGCAAATFAARCKWKVLVIDRGMDNGFLGSLSNVSYFPGFPESISGQELVKRMRRQSELVGVHFMSDTVKTISTASVPFKITTEFGKEFDASTIVVATGAALRTNYLHGEKEFLGRGVSHDALADGPSVAKRTAAVVGRSKTAITEALILSRFADKIHFIIPSSKIEAEDKLIKQLEKHKSVELHYSTSLKKINGTDHVSSITIFTGGQEKEISVAGAFTYVHEYQPTTSFLDKVVELAPGGAVKISDNLQTSFEGIFACGDVLCGRPQLPAVSAAQGLLAAMSVDKFLVLKSGE